MPAILSKIPRKHRPVTTTNATSNTSSFHGEELSDEAKALMNNSVCEETRIRKKRYVHAFLQWAEESNYKAGDIYPPSEPILCNYASTFGGRVAGATAKGYLSAVKSWVLGAGLEWRGNDRLRRVLEGVERNAPASSFREERAPVRIEHLELLLHDLDLSGNSSFDTCVAATAVTLFFGQMRAGEALASSPKLSNFKPSILPTVSSLTPSSDPGSLILHLPRTKTSQVKGDRVVISPQNNVTSPTHALMDHISVSKLLPNDPLFSYRPVNGPLTVLTKNKFLAKVNSIWTTHGIREVSGHCFRIGGTTHFLISGVNPEVVKALGRWKSDAFLTYWRNLESIASMHLHRFHARDDYYNRLRAIL